MVHRCGASRARGVQGVVDLGGSRRSDRDADRGARLETDAVERGRHAGGAQAGLRRRQRELDRDGRAGSGPARRGQGVAVYVDQPRQAGEPVPVQIRRRTGAMRADLLQDVAAHHDPGIVEHPVREDRGDGPEHVVARRYGRMPTRAADSRGGFDGGFGQRFEGHGGQPDTGG